MLHQYHFHYSTLYFIDFSKCREPLLKLRGDPGFHPAILANAMGEGGSFSSQKEIPHHFMEWHLGFPLHFLKNFWWRALPQLTKVQACIWGFFFFLIQPLWKVGGVLWWPHIHWQKLSLCQLRVFALGWLLGIQGQVLWTACALLCPIISVREVILGVCSTGSRQDLKSEDVHCFQGHPINGTQTTFCLFTSVSLQGPLYKG